MVVSFAHNFIAAVAGEVGENPTLTRNRELVMASRITTTFDDFLFLTTRRGLRGGELFAIVNSSLLRGSQ